MHDFFVAGEEEIEKENESTLTEVQDSSNSSLFLDLSARPDHAAQSFSASPKLLDNPNPQLENPYFKIESVPIPKPVTKAPSQWFGGFGIFGSTLNQPVVDFSRAINEKEENNEKDENNNNDNSP